MDEYDGRMVRIALFGSIPIQLVATVCKAMNREFQGRKALALDGYHPLSRRLGATMVLVTADDPALRETCAETVLPNQQDFSKLELSRAFELMELGSEDTGRQRAHRDQALPKGRVPRPLAVEWLNCQTKAQKRKYSAALRADAALVEAQAPMARTARPRWRMHSWHPADFLIEVEGFGVRPLANNDDHGDANRDLWERVSEELSEAGWEVEPPCDDEGVYSRAALDSLVWRDFAAAPDHVQVAILLAVLEPPENTERTA